MHLSHLLIYTQKSSHNISVNRSIESIKCNYQPHHPMMVLVISEYRKSTKDAPKVLRKNLVPKLFKKRDEAPSCLIIFVKQSGIPS